MTTHVSHEPSYREIRLWRDTKRLIPDESGLLELLGVHPNPAELWPANAWKAKPTRRATPFFQ